MGEMDLVALDGRTLVVLEVRSKQTGHPDDAARTVDKEKQRRLSLTALWFRKRHRLEALPLRFDVAALFCEARPAHRVFGEINCANFPDKDIPWLMAEAAKIEGRTACLPKT